MLPISRFVVLASTLLFAGSLAACSAEPEADPQEDPTRELTDRVSASTFLDKVTAGYQGWFTAKGDGSPIDGWTHWSRSTPSAGNVTFELYPDTRDYADGDLYQTGFAP